MGAPFINIHTHRRTGEGIEVVSMMAGSGRDEWPVSPFSVGIHPWQAAELNEDALDGALHEVATAPASIIGEIGLDRVNVTDYEAQKTIFAAQLKIARLRHLPVVLHCVRAFEQTMATLAACTPPAVVFHGFVGSRVQAELAVAAGYRLSLGERSFASPKTVEALRDVPLDSIFLETDDSPVSIAVIYSRAAEVLDIPRDRLAVQLQLNYERLVGENRTAVGG